MVQKINLATCEADNGSNSFAGLLAKKGDNVLRDSFIFFSPETSVARRLTVGYTVVYPKCRTNGHAHGDKEEVYFILAGRGQARVGEEVFEVGPGDCFYVTPGLFHGVENIGTVPLTYLWAIADL